MSRRAAREVVLQTLFQIDVGKNDPETALHHCMEGRELTEVEQSFAEQMVSGTVAKRDEIDQLISRYSSEWSISRMPNVDRNVLRMAVYEIRFEPATPAAIAVNEAVELAKRFGTDDSPRFVNGVLGNLTRALQATSGDE